MSRARDEAEGPIDFGDGVEHEELGGTDAFVMTLAP